MLMNCPLEKWSTRKIDQIIDQGQQICAKTTDLTITAKRIIKNILIDKNYFDIVAKTSQETNWTSMLFVIPSLHTQLLIFVLLFCSL